jgi:hypothetical protein
LSSSRWASAAEAGSSVAGLIWHDWKSCPSRFLSGGVGAYIQNNSNFKGSGQECPLHDFSVILSEAKDPVAARASGEAARHSHHAAEAIVRMP